MDLGLTREAFELLIAGAVWSAIFHVFGFIGYFVHAHRSVWQDAKWLTLLPAQREGDGVDVDTPHRREEDPAVHAYVQSRRGMVLDAEEACWRMSFFAWLAIPGSALCVVGLPAFGIGLAGVPMLVAAYTCWRQARRLSASDTAFFKFAPMQRTLLVASALWTVLVAIGLASVHAEVLVLLAPTLIASLFALDLARRIAPAERALEANLDTRGVRY